jgi:hypothetical protein
MDKRILELAKVLENWETERVKIFFEGYEKLAEHFREDYENFKQGDTGFIFVNYNVPTEALEGFKRGMEFVLEHIKDRIERRKEKQSDSLTETLKETL